MTTDAHTHTRPAGVCPAGQHNARLTALPSWSRRGGMQVMRIRGLQTTALVGVCVALTAAGCSHSAAQTTPTPTTTVAAPTTTQTTPDDTAITQAQQAITAYYKVDNQVGQYPGSDLAMINTVAAGQEAYELTNEIQGSRAQGRHAVGDITIASVKPTGVNITKRDADVTADVCYDLSKSQTVDAQGAAVPHQTTMQAGAPDGSNQIVTVPWRDQRLGRFTVHNASWPDPTAWRVTKTEQRNAPCS